MNKQDTIQAIDALNRTLSTLIFINRSLTEEEENLKKAIIVKLDKLIISL